jgi:hypothetical protein
VQNLSSVELDELFDFRLTGNFDVVPRVVRI